MTTRSKNRTTETGKNKKKAGKEPANTSDVVVKTTMLDLMIAELCRPEGATVADLMAVTGWQAHSVRGAMAGSLKKKGHVILSEKIEGQRRYRIGETG
ncbi:MAG: DUF3489 domain-containing protein [Geminicoccaceae bacterium]